MTVSRRDRHVPGGTVALIDGVGAQPCDALTGGGAPKRNLLARDMGLPSLQADTCVLMS